MTHDATYSGFDRVSAAIYVLEVGELGRPIYAAVNAFALEEAGRPLSDFQGRTAMQVFPQAYGRAAYARQCEVIATRRPHSFELTLPLRGHLRTMRTTLTPESDATGKVIRIFGTHIDVTPERDAHTAKVEFDALSAEMEDFVAFAAHDLHAPMKNVAMLAEILRQDLDSADKDTIDILDMMDRVVANSINMISDVLAHAQAAATDRHESIFSFPVVCHDICATLDPQRKHRVLTSLSTVKSDRSVVQIALRNLLENAIKHGGQDSLRIEVSARDSHGGMLEITLSDNGQGFSELALRAMNGKKFKADSGYGLFGVKRLIAARGGTLAAENRTDGPGAIVRFSIPGQLVGADPLVSERTMASRTALAAGEVWPRHNG